MIRHRVSFAGCGAGEIGTLAARIVLVLGLYSLAPGAAAAQGRLEARATVISAVAAWEGLAVSDSVGRIGLGADSLLRTKRRVDGPISSVFWYDPLPPSDVGAADPVRRPARTDQRPGPGTARVARVLEIHYLRN